MCRRQSDWRSAEERDKFAFCVCIFKGKSSVIAPTTKHCCFVVGLLVLHDDLWSPRKRFGEVLYIGYLDRYNTIYKLEKPYPMNTLPKTHLRINPLKKLSINSFKIAMLNISNLTCISTLSLD